MLVVHAALWFFGVASAAIGSVNYVRVLVVEANHVSPATRVTNDYALIRHGIVLGLSAAAFVVNASL